MSDREKYMVKVILMMLRDSDRKVSELTDRLRNDSAEVKRNVAANLSEEAFIEFYNGRESGSGARGRIPVFARLTDKGRKFIGDSRVSSSIWGA